MPIKFEAEQSDSDESTAVSIPRKNFKCPFCWRSFETGQALGGHQNAHRSERDKRKINKLYQAHFEASCSILEAFSVHFLTIILVILCGTHVPTISTNYQTLFQPQYSSAIVGTRLHYHLHQDHDHHTYGARSPMCQHGPYDHHYQPLMTNDYLDEWMPIYNIGGSVPTDVAEATAARSLERIMSNSIPKGLKELGGDEVSLGENEKEVDLELSIMPHSFDSQKSKYCCSWL
ncbi:LOW QUALITY PROTEIN: Yin/yang transcription factor [Parasponia andersonii]|uniref:Yin/yang transcription factor n=1 Tax=Parasponia andersonii TaxID=3476 RepID=A0A2P5AMP0_PARAD|nr:LOW QUALITY PROTEIN: Yin/yang transcription factor [Parasponia andersonii]